MQNTEVFDGAQVIDVVVGIVLMVLAITSLLLLGMTRGDDERRGAEEERP